MDYLKDKTKSLLTGMVLILTQWEEMRRYAKVRTWIEGSIRL